MILLFLGPPGSGKGTQGQIIARKRGLLHISTGDLLRSAAAKKNPTAIEIKIKDMLGSGSLIPDNLINEMVKDAVASKSSNYILDGYPRTINQAEFFLSEFAQEVKILFFDIPDELIMKRLSSRLVCKECGAIYSEGDGVDLTRCSNCGAQHSIVKRSDDKEEVIAKRLQDYRAETLPLLDFYKKTNHVVNIDARLPESDVTSQIESFIESI